MTRSNGLRKALVLSALVLVSSVVGPGSTLSANAASSDPLTMVPGESLFCLRINNLDAALGQTDLFLTGLLPFGSNMIVKMQLSELLGSPEPKGIDMAGSFALFGPMSGGETFDPTQIGMLVPVSDYQQFVAGNPNVSQPDATGVSKIGAEGKQTFKAIQVGNYALVSTPGNEEGMAWMRASTNTGRTTALVANLDPVELKRAQNSPMWAYVNLQRAGKMFGSVIQAKIQETREKALQETTAKGQKTSGEPNAFTDMSAHLVDTLMQQAKFISVSLEPSAETLRAAFVVSAMPRTEMAGMLQEDPTEPDSKLLGYLEDGAVMNFAGSMDSPIWNKLNQAYLALLPEYISKNASDEDMEKIKRLATDATDALGGTVVVSFSADLKNKPPFAVKYVASLKDSAKFYRVLDEASKMMAAGPLADVYKNLGMKLSFDVKRKAETYKGVAIDAINFTMESTDPNSQETQLINSIYGGGFNIRMAAVDGLLVYALAKEPGPVVRELIDQVKAGGPGPASGEVQTAMQLIPGASKADFFGTYNILRLMQMVTAMTPTPIPQMDVPTQSSMAIAGNVGDEKMSVEVALPKQHVLEILMVVMKMQQQKMQQGEQG